MWGPTVGGIRHGLIQAARARQERDTLDSKKKRLANSAQAFREKKRSRSPTITMDTRLYMGDESPMRQIKNMRQSTPGLSPLDITDVEKKWRYRSRSPPRPSMLSTQSGASHNQSDNSTLPMMRSSSLLSPGRRAVDSNSPMRSFSPGTKYRQGIPISPFFPMHPAGSMSPSVGLSASSSSNRPPVNSGFSNWVPPTGSPYGPSGMTSNLAPRPPIFSGSFPPGVPPWSVPPRPAQPAFTYDAAKGPIPPFKYGISSFATGQPSSWDFPDPPIVLPDEKFQQMLPPHIPLNKISSTWDPEISEAPTITTKAMEYAHHIGKNNDGRERVPFLSQSFSQLLPGPNIPNISDFMPPPTESGGARKSLNEGSSPLSDRDHFASTWRRMVSEVQGILSGPTGEPILIGESCHACGQTCDTLSGQSEAQLVIHGNRVAAGMDALWKWTDHWCQTVASLTQQLKQSEQEAKKMKEIIDYFINQYPKQVQQIAALQKLVTELTAQKDAQQNDANRRIQDFYKSIKQHIAPAGFGGRGQSQSWHPGMHSQTRSWSPSYRPSVKSGVPDAPMRNVMPSPFYPPSVPTSPLWNGVRAPSPGRSVPGVLSTLPPFNVRALSSSPPPIFNCQNPFAPDEEPSTKNMLDTFSSTDRKSTESEVHSSIKLDTASEIIPSVRRDAFPTDRKSSESELLPSVRHDIVPEDRNNRKYQSEQVDRYSAGNETQQKQNKIKEFQPISNTTMTPSGSSGLSRKESFYYKQQNNDKSPQQKLISKNSSSSLGNRSSSTHTLSRGTSKEELIKKNPKSPSPKPITKLQSPKQKSYSSQSKANHRENSPLSSHKKDNINNHELLDLHGSQSRRSISLHFDHLPKRGSISMTQNEYQTINPSQEILSLGSRDTNQEFYENLMSNTKNELHEAPNQSAERWHTIHTRSPTGSTTERSKDLLQKTYDAPDGCTSVPSGSRSKSSGSAREVMIHADGLFSNPLLQVSGRTHGSRSSLSDDALDPRKNEQLIHSNYTQKQIPLDTTVSTILPFPQKESEQDLDHIAKHNRYLASFLNRSRKNKEKNNSPQRTFDFQYLNERASTGEIYVHRHEEKPQQATDILVGSQKNKQKKATYNGSMEPDPSRSSKKKSTVEINLNEKRSHSSNQSRSSKNKVDYDQRIIGQQPVEEFPSDKTWATIRYEGFDLDNQKIEYGAGIDSSHRNQSPLESPHCDEDSEYFYVQDSERSPLKQTYCNGHRDNEYRAHSSESYAHDSSHSSTIQKLSLRNNSKQDNGNRFYSQDTSPSTIKKHANTFDISKKEIRSSKSSNRSKNGVKNLQNDLRRLKRRAEGTGFTGGTYKSSPFLGESSQRQSSPQISHKEQNNTKVTPQDRNLIKPETRWKHLQNDLNNIKQRASEILIPDDHSPKPTQRIFVPHKRIPTAHQSSRRGSNNMYHSRSHSKNRVTPHYRDTNSSDSRYESPEIMYHDKLKNTVDRGLSNHIRSLTENEKTNHSSHQSYNNNCTPLPLKLKDYPSGHRKSIH